MSYTVTDCTMLEMDDQSKPVNTFKILDDRCVVNDDNGRLKSFGHSLVRKI